MRTVTLVENSAFCEGCTAEHGLCIYIETEKHRILADTGQTDALVKNAALLGIDLGGVDTVVLSHGHYDHSGGIMPFSEINGTARIYMHERAAEPHFNMEKYIGIDERIPALPNVITTGGELRIDDELYLFSGVTGRRCFPEGNKRLKMLSGGFTGEKVCDDFAHEQYLLITSGGKMLLVSGCAHNGILNILDRCSRLTGRYPDVVMTGFHMMKRDGDHTPAEISVIKQTAEELRRLPTVFYSGHCTGQPAFDIMKEIMGDKLMPLGTGVEIIL